MIRFWDEDGDYMLNEGNEKFNVLEMKIVIDCKKKPEW